MPIWKQILSSWDLALAPLYLLFILAFAFFYKQLMVRKHPEYKNFLTGLAIKIFGGLAFACIYLFYYDGGDTTLYYQSTLSLLNIASVSPSSFFGILTGNLTAENAMYFGSNYGWSYYYNDFQSYSVVRFSSPFVFIAGKSYITATILISTFTYIGLWKLYQLLYYRFPDVRKGLAFAILYIPSTVFWGSGLLKDSFTLMASCLMLVAFYNLFVLRKKIRSSIFYMLIGFYLLVSLKPYIFFALAAAFIIAMSYQYIREIKNVIVKVVFIPIIIVSVFAGGALLMTKVGQSLGGQYESMDKLLKKASDTQFDLKQEYYQGNTFDIGSFEPTITGILSKAHVAILAGLYRPYLWDSRNPVMLLSSLENTMFLLLSLYLVMLSFMTWRKNNLKHLWGIIFHDSFIIFSLTFVTLFAFSVGLSTANFGALVRYKIPLIPFFLCTLFILVNKFNKEKKGKFGMH